MVRIAGVILPSQKRIEIALTYIYGIGRNLSKQILEIAKIDINKKTESLSDAEEKKLREIIARYITEGD